MVVFTQAMQLMTFCAIAISVPYSTSSSSFQMEEVRRIIFQYYLACGPSNICNISQFEMQNIESYSQETLQLCPKCSCEESCFTRRDCCPDIYFTRISRTCEKFVVSSKHKTSDSYLVVDSCPHNSPSYLKDACHRDYSAAESFFHPPVTSNMTLFTYKNEFCARCNSDFSAFPWSWYVRCKLPIDFNFVSSYPDLVQRADSDDCILEYAPFRASASRCDHVTDGSHIISKCNVSRTWSKWNPDILKACESGYQHRFGVFKNVFCHLCNPPLQTQTSQDTKSLCDTISDKNNLVEACKNLPSLESFGAFRNGFCMKCLTESIKENPFLDLNATAEEQYTIQGLFEYEITVHSFHDNYIKEVIEERARRPEYSNGRKLSMSNFKSRVTEDTGSVMLQVGVDQFVNLSNIVQKFFALEPTGICNGDLLPQNLSLFATSICSCDPACLFTESCNCCLDTALLSSATCVSDKIFSKKTEDENHFLTTNTCRNRGLDPTYFRIISDLCKSEEIGVLSIPVLHKGSGVTHRNIFCLMCNEQMSMSSVLPVITDKYDIWDILLKCPERIDSRYANKINDLILLGTTADCDIKLIPKAARRCPKYDEAMISKCNETGNWMEQDKDIQWACENVSTSLLPPYYDRKNAFCNLCNPDEKLYDKITSRCNTTGNWLEYDPIIEQGCYQLPFIQNELIYPFKNDFCAFCNGYDVPQFLLPDTYCDKVTENTNSGNDKNNKTISSISVVTVFQNRAPADYTSMQEVSSIFDPVKKTKRHIHCYPGRHLVGNDCVVVIANSIHLRYSLTLVLEGHMMGEGQRMLRMIRGAIFAHIREKLEIRALDIQTSYLMSNISCESTNSQTEEKEVKILFHGSLYLRGPVIRNKVESVLLDLHQPNGEIFLASDYFNLTFIYSKEAYNIPTLINSGKSRRRCFLSDQNLMIKENVDHTIFISRMLFCKQVQFQRNEITYDEVHIQVQLRQYNKTFHNEEFFMTTTGEVRICLEDFMTLLSNVKTSSLSNNKDNNNKNASNILQLSQILQCIFAILLARFI